MTKKKKNGQNLITKLLNKGYVMPKNAKFYSLLCVGLLSALTLTKAENLDAEIQRLEKQKKILELKRQNHQLQKELDRTNSPSNYQNNTPSNYQGNYPNSYPNAQPKSKQNYPKGNQPQYYAPPAQGTTQAPKQNKARYYYEEEDDDEEVVYTSEKDTQFYIRLEGGAYAGGYLRLAPLAGLELGVKFNDSGRFFLGSSYAWSKGNQFIVDGYLGIGWIPRIFDSPVRIVLDSYIGASYGEWNSERTYDKNNCPLIDYNAIIFGKGCRRDYVTERSRSTGVGFLAGVRTGFAFDIGRHTWLEFGAKLDATLGSLLNLVAVGYGSFSILF